MRKKMDKRERERERIGKYEKESGLDRGRGREVKKYMRKKVDKREGGRKVEIIWERRWIRKKEK